MKEKDDKKKKKLIIYAIMIALIIGFVALIIILLTFEKETHTYKKYEYDDMSALVCVLQSNDADNDFFSSDGASDVKHTIKLVYSNNLIQKMSYEYNGFYDSEENARKDSGELHAKYNIYMGDHGVNHDILAPVFQNNNNKALIRLYLDDYGKMNSTIAKLFYIGNGMIDTISKNSLDETKKLYENRDFSCIISD